MMAFLKRIDLLNPFLYINRHTQSKENLRSPECSYVYLRHFVTQEKIEMIFLPVHSHVITSPTLYSMGNSNFERGGSLLHLVSEFDWKIATCFVVEVNQTIAYNIHVCRINCPVILLQKGKRKEELFPCL